ncbi:hypothetical protein Aph01nite_59200 [Acrocarpospora phusangensis]|uniref:Tape measure protein n=1 Tax=Acrocarpospora phusangensis TaxID=1070424 RepID=A0A919QJR6_9ACTN|nr:hypothetical protein [Acrocarpospora phusangensis]GIH27610.1 hypothetical protein Aph01nite_59200 [Acrocarpospora phusangensis]
MANSSLVFRLFGRDISLGSALQGAGNNAEILNARLKSVGSGVTASFSTATKGVSLLGLVGAGVFAGMSAGMAGVGLGIAGIGIAAAAQSKEVKSAFTDLAKDARATITEAAMPLVPVLTNVAKQAGTLLKPLEDSLGKAFTAMAPALKSFTGSLVTGIKPVIASIGPIATAVSPLIESLGAGLVPVMSALAGTLTIVAQTAGKFAPQLEQMFVGIGQIITVLGPLLSGLIQLGAPIIGPLLSLIAGLVGQLSTALMPVFAQLGPIIGQILTAMNPLVPAIGLLFAALTPLLVPIAQLISQLVIGLVPVLVPIIGLLAKVAGQIVALLVPALKFITPILVTVIGWIGNLAEFILSVLSGAISWLVENVPKAWQLVKTGVGAAVNGVKAIISWFGNLPGLIGGWFGRMKDRAVAKAVELVTWIKGLPGRIKSGLGNLASNLLSAGRDLILGLINGVKQMAANVINAVKGVIGDAIQGAKNLLGIASPSKVFTWIGQMTGKGLVKGLLGTLTEIKSASKKMSDTVLSAWKQKRISFNAAESLLSVISQGNTKLQSLANKRESILKQIEDAHKFAVDIADKARGTAALTSLDLGEGKKVTASKIQAQISIKLSQIKRFSAVVKQLAARGLNKSLLQQVIEAGPEEGLALGEALLEADAGTLTAINSAQSAINTASTSLGNLSADALYDSGVQAGKGFLTGLAAQKSAILAAMDDLANALVQRVRKALKIKSPSRLLHELGAFSGQGFVGGINSTLDSVANAGERLAGAAIPIGRPTPVTPQFGARASGSPGNSDVRVVIDVTGADQDMIKMIRKWVRIEGRGSVDLAFGKG